MSEKEQQEYKKQTGKRPLYFNKPSNDFKKWLNEKDKPIDVTDLELIRDLIKDYEEKSEKTSNLKYWLGIKKKEIKEHAKM